MTPIAYRETFNTRTYFDVTKFFTYCDKTARPQVRYSDVWSAIQALSRIHSGIKGQSIPAEVMEFYMTMKGGDRHRPDMLKKAVLSMSDAIQNGILDRPALYDLALRHLANKVLSLSPVRLEQWLQDHPRRAAFMPKTSITRADCLRMAWLEEGREIIADVFDYADAMTRTRF